MSLVCNYCGSDDIEAVAGGNDIGIDGYFCNHCQDYCEPVLESDFLNKQKLGECCC